MQGVCYNASVKRADESLGVRRAHGVKWTQMLQLKRMCQGLVTCPNQTNGIINSYLDVTLTDYPQLDRGALTDAVLIDVQALNHLGRKKRFFCVSPDDF